MIRSFRDTRTQALASGAPPKGISPDVARRAVVKLFMLDTVTRLEDLRVPPVNRLEALFSDRSGQHSIRVNDRQGVTAALALRLGKYFGVDPRWFMNMQTQFDLQVEATRLADKIAAIAPREAA